ncbi:single-stranded DNA-binding protein [Salmonella enterica]|uniref:recombination mediator protein UvsY n=1 Tax=Salmonella enterica TaxID=28901 RepID=UPI0009AD7155|nr:recombination mediator protein UvsY [Salmonella enterica]ECI4635300.1 single-stranded DNA-binding protein [Salmonella enterica subsp. enterica]EDU6338875.1 single-stranded DNA-binding protein [Salmonella enterica subsp. enterica serovar Weltevreden]EGZ4114314.1 single-stranded DNA-binding protein [Salmonella enterica subsp. enterica serovar Tallahassee]EAM6533155.1 single-stranded DNA-binding protein [Salmonella enterica]EAP5863691.1 single-stranded DNA-binding protein [Salmonella enterica]
MKLEELNEQLTKDLEVDQTKLSLELSKNPLLHARWLRVYNEARREIISLEAKKKKLLKDKIDYYSNRGDEFCPFEYSTSELKIVLNADSELLPVDTKIEYYSLIADFANKALDAVKGRGYAINNMVKLRELESGK